MKWFLHDLLLALGLLALPVAVTAGGRQPIIDMHLHAVSPAINGGIPPHGTCMPLASMPRRDAAEAYDAVFSAAMANHDCKDPLPTPATDDEMRVQTLAMLEKHNVIGVLSAHSDAYDKAWRKAAPERLIPAGPVFLDPLKIDAGVVARVKAMKASGDLAVLGEIGPQYSGILPDDPRLAPFWTMAEDLDLPVGIHIGTGPPGAPYAFGGAFKGYRARLHSPLTIEEVLIRHPKLRVYLMHAGYPMLDDLLATLYAHPQLYVDIGVIGYTQPRPAFYRFLQGIVEAGFADRVMFGSDNMNWPGAIERTIQDVEEAPFLSQRQKRDILYNNAARFLRLDRATIRRHHAM